MLYVRRWFSRTVILTSVLAFCGQLASADDLVTISAKAAKRLGGFSYSFIEEQFIDNQLFQDLKCDDLKGQWHPIATAGNQKFGGEAFLKYVVSNPLVPYAYRMSIDGACNIPLGKKLKAKIERRNAEGVLAGSIEDIRKVPYVAAAFEAPITQTSSAAFTFDQPEYFLNAPDGVGLLPGVLANDDFGMTERLEVTCGVVAHTDTPLLACRYSLDMFPSHGRHAKKEITHINTSYVIFTDRGEESTDVNVTFNGAEVATPVHMIPVDCDNLSEIICDHFEAGAVVRLRRFGETRQAAITGASAAGGMDAGMFWSLLVQGRQHLPPATYADYLKRIESRSSPEEIHTLVENIKSRLIEELSDHPEFSAYASMVDRLNKTQTYTQSEWAASPRAQQHPDVARWCIDDGGELGGAAQYDGNGPYVLLCSGLFQPGIEESQTYLIIAHELVHAAFTDTAHGANGDNNTGEMAMPHWEACVKSAAPREGIERILGEWLADVLGAGAVARYETAVHADWFAEIDGKHYVDLRALKPFQNLCRPDISTEGGYSLDFSHPDRVERFNSSVLANPTMSAALGCPTLPHCDGK